MNNLRESFLFALKKPDVAAKRAVLKFQGYTLPRRLYIGVTYKCQCRCAHCAVGASQARQNELLAEEIKNIIKDAKKYLIPRVTFIGGEPLLREDITELVACATASGLEASIFTNGILLGNGMVRELKKAGLRKCNISLDSSYPEVHDTGRGYKGCFERTTGGIRKLAEAGIGFSIWTIASKEDVANGLADMKRLIQMAKGWKAGYVMILFPMAAGNWNDRTEKETLLTREEREEIRKLYDPPFVCMEFPREDAPCVGGKRFIYIDPVGDVSPCPSIPPKLANVRQVSLGGVLKNFNKYMERFNPCAGECAMNKRLFSSEQEIVTCRKMV